MSLSVHGLHFTYPGWEPTLRGVDLEVPPGQSGFLTGPSGCGKTTLLRCIAGLEQPDEGQIMVGTDRIDGLPPHRRRVGMLFQEPALFPHFDAATNVAFGLAYRDVARPERRKEAVRWLELVDLHRPDAPVDELSGGQRQRVALARTLAAQPRAILLDEPFSALDRPLRDELGPKVKELLARQGIPALWVTHDTQEASRQADLAWHLEEGRALPQ